MEDEELERIRAKKLAELMGTLKEKEPAKVGGGEPVVLTDLNFAKVVTSSKLVLVDFWADWCQPCRMVSPAVEELGRQFAGKVVIGKMNVDENPSVPSQFGVQSIPTLLLFKDGRLVDGIVGAVPKAQLEGMVRKWM